METEKIGKELGRKYWVYRGKIFPNASVLSTVKNGKSFLTHVFISHDTSLSILPTF